jgi:uncharacterized protein YndB with AHSA1/START domain
MVEPGSPASAASRAVSEPEFSLTRSFDAPRALVFGTWTQARHLARWWGPAGYEAIHADIDLRPGGVFLYGLRAKDGATIWGRWLFRVVSMPDSLELLSASCDERGRPQRHALAPDWPLETLATLRFIDAGERTTVALTGVPFNASPHECEVFASAVDSMRQGWKGTLDRFEAYLPQAERGSGLQA